MHTLIARQCAGQNPSSRENLGVVPSFEDKGFTIHVPVLCM